MKKLNIEDRRLIICVKKHMYESVTICYISEYQCADVLRSSWRLCASAGGKGGDSWAHSPASIDLSRKYD
jgi:hypothetical protein